MNGKTVNGVAACFVSAGNLRPKANLQVQPQNCEGEVEIETLVAGRHSDSALQGVTNSYMTNEPASMTSIE